jgi:hypothetical protein
MVVADEVFMTFALAPIPFEIAVIVAVIAAVPMIVIRMRGGYCSAQCGD